MSGKTATWLETQAGTLALAGKVAGAFATAGYVHGGGDLAMQGILTHLLVFGCLAYSGGAACGKPVIHLGPVALADNINAYRATFETYGKRMAAKCIELFGK
jgi:NAD(P)H dehydrogenase (quinone)